MGESYEYDEGHIKVNRKVVPMETVLGGKQAPRYGGSKGSVNVTEEDNGLIKHVTSDDGVVNFRYAVDIPQTFFVRHDPDVYLVTKGKVRKLKREDTAVITEEALKVDKDALTASEVVCKVYENSDKSLNHNIVHALNKQQKKTTSGNELTAALEACISVLVLGVSGAGAYFFEVLEAQQPLTLLLVLLTSGIVCRTSAALALAPQEPDLGTSATIVGRVVGRILCGLDASFKPSNPLTPRFSYFVPLLWVFSLVLCVTLLVAWIVTYVKRQSLSKPKGPSEAGQESGGPSEAGQESGGPSEAGQESGGPSEAGQESGGALEAGEPFHDGVPWFFKRVFVPAVVVTYVMLVHYTTLFPSPAVKGKMLAEMAIYRLFVTFVAGTVSGEPMSLWAETVGLLFLVRVVVEREQQTVAEHVQKVAKETSARMRDEKLAANALQRDAETRNVAL